MRLITSIVCWAVFAGLLLADEGKSRGLAAWAWASACANAPTKIVPTIPPGYHAHRRTDGTVLIHADDNLGDPNAHAGVASPWVQIAGAGDKLPADTVSSQAVYSSGGCPSGNCPTSRSSIFRRRR